LKLSLEVIRLEHEIDEIEEIREILKGKILYDMGN